MWRNVSDRILCGSKRFSSHLLSKTTRADAPIIARHFTGFPQVGAGSFTRLDTRGKNSRLIPKLRNGTPDSCSTLSRDYWKPLTVSSGFSTLSFSYTDDKGSAALARKNVLGRECRCSWFCTAAKPAVNKDTELLQPSPEENNNDIPKRSTETDPWLLRNLVVTTSVNRRADRPQGMTFNVGYMDTGGDWHESKRKVTPTILAIPGQPGSHEDLLPVVRPLHEDGHRVIIVNMPCYEFSKGLTDDDEYFYKNSTSDLAEFVYNFMEVLEMTRTDLVVTHSAGSIPYLVLSATSDIVKSGMIICTPSGHVPSRVNRPMWFINTIVAVWATRPGRAFMSWFLPKFNKVVNWLNTDDPCQLMASAKFGAHNNFGLMKKIAAQFSAKQIPLVYFASKNDRLVELELSLAWAKMLGIEREQFDLYSEDYAKIEDGKRIGDGYRKGVLLTKGGHYPQRKESALSVLVKEARALMERALKNV